MKFDPMQQGARSGASPVPATFGIVAGAAVAELAELVGAGERLHGFYLAVGRRIAAAETLEGIDDAPALGLRVNAFWATIGWGQAELAIERDAIVVRHRDAPQAPPGVTEEAWATMLLGVLEGAYDAWFRRLGSGPTLKTRAEWQGDMLELRHGR